MSGELPSAADIPDALSKFEQWVGWRPEERDGNQTKIPIDPSTGQYASATDPETWGAFDEAADVVERGDAVGVGFVFTDEDPFVGIDLDDCRDPESGEPEQWAAEIIETLTSYTEVSPSGTGYHVLVRGTLPEGRNRHGDVELYETARYFTITGTYVGRQRTIHERTAELATVHAEHVAQQTMPSAESASVGTAGVDHGDSSPADHRDGEPQSTGLSDEELLNRARNATNGEKFERLWSGDIAGYDSQSEADMALCCLLAFWTGGDSRQMDRLFRESDLVREKWDKVHFADGSTYGEKTIERAIGATSEFYDPGSRERASVDEQPGRTPSASQQSVATQKLRELIEDHHQLTERVEALTRTVEQQADRIETLERRLTTLQAETDSAPPERHSSIVTDDADGERDASTGRSGAPHNDDRTVESEHSDDAPSTDSEGSFVSRTRRFLGHRSDDA
jgi:primase-polymerase (primpol)-like protein